MPSASMDDVEAGAFVGGFPAFGFENVIFELSSVDFFVDEGFFGFSSASETERDRRRESDTKRVFIDGSMTKRVRAGKGR